jgi:cytochrome c oxidase assembly protein subunit 15
MMNQTSATSASSVTVRTLRYTSAAAAVFAFALVVWGGIVRINNAGMTCPDWPRCRGAWFPSLNDSVIYEWTHRLGAPVLTLLIIATFVAAWRARRDVPIAWRASWFSMGLLVAQVVVGGLTIKYINNPPSVAAHLGLGILTFGSLLLVWFVSTRPPAAPLTAGPYAAVASRLALSATIATFCAILAAGYMSASNAGLACTQFPLCTGWGPAETLAQQIHMGHRLLAYLSFALIAALAFVMPRVGAGALLALSRLALVLGVLQIGLGAATIVSGLEPVLRSVHQANGALLLATLALLTYVAYASAPAGEVAAQPAALAPQEHS